jgi:hypothetical protein
MPRNLPFSQEDRHEMKRFMMLTLLAFVASCERVAVREYVAPKQTFPQKAAVREEIEQAQNSAQTPAISLKAPPHWQRQPLAPIRKASFVVEEADGAKVDISVTSFPGESGGLLANINRWRGSLVSMLSMRSSSNQLSNDGTWADVSL